MLGRRGASAEFVGLDAIILGVGYVALGGILHFARFWWKMEGCRRVAVVGTILSTLLALANVAHIAVKYAFQDRTFEEEAPVQLDRQTFELLREALDRLDAGFRHLPDLEHRHDLDEMRAVLLEVAGRMHDNFPYFHPLYAGQMLKPPHPIARLAYALSIWINPNNHALDGSRASSPMEKEAVAALAGMFGWDRHLGHLTSGGTMANLEALWVSGRLAPGKRILASEQSHYTHRRISEVLQLPFGTVPVDDRGRMRLDALEEAAGSGDVGAVVATLGTTATGSIDPLDGIVSLAERHGFRVHADAAYGGYFTLVDGLPDEARRAFDALASVDSSAIDPHKHGLQPYGCGAILFRDPSVGTLYKHDSPYTYFSSDDLHLGEISLECSRAGASAVALWATQRMLPLERGGRFASDLGRCREAAARLHERLAADERVAVALAPELDIVIWAPRSESPARTSDLSRTIFRRAAARDLHLAVARLPVRFFPGLAAGWGADVTPDTEVSCLRSCLMKPEHLDWVDRIAAILDEETAAALEAGAS